MNFRIFESQEELIRAAAREVIQRAIDGSVIALSGGSTPEPLYAILGADAALRDRTITWVVVDERYVPHDDPRSNSAMIERTLFARGISPTHRFLRFRTDRGDAEDTARQFEQEWHELGIGLLDLVILGVGEDGHTASLFPGTTALEIGDGVAAAVFVPKLEMWRVTLTLPVIRAAKRRMVLAEGESKHAVIEQLRAGADLPVARATGGELETWWFADKAAAG